MDLRGEIEQGKEDWAFCVGVQAYLWGVTVVECWKDRLTKLGVRANGGRAASELPLNAFEHVRALLTPESSQEFVNAATDFLYSTAVLDLRDGPLTLTAPNFGGRWYCVQVLDPYMETHANLGTRTCGEQVPPVVIANDRAPAVSPATQLVRCGSDFPYLVVRIAVDPNEDMRAVHALQDGLRLGRLDASSTLAASTPSSDQPLAIRDALYGVLPSVSADAADDFAFFADLAAVMRMVPPKADEGMLAAQLSAIGFDASASFDSAALPESTRKGLARAAPFARGMLDRKLFEAADSSVNGWGSLKDVGHYGKNYVARAVIAKVGPWATVPEEAMYFMCWADQEGNALEGGTRYQLKFLEGAMPPVHAFWSITSYDLAGRLSANAIGKTAINSTYSKLEYAADGSLCINIGGGAGEGGGPANWLPTHDGQFTLTFRCYNPAQALLEHAYHLPPVVKLV